MGKGRHLEAGAPFFRFSCEQAGESARGEISRRSLHLFAWVIVRARALPESEATVGGHGFSRADKSGISTHAPMRRN